MTLVVGITGRKSVWLLTDRRLSAKGKVVRDDAIKAVSLKFGSDIALLGYAGLGATKRGIQPSDWIAGLLRGRKLPLEESLVTIGRAVAAQVPRHLAAGGYFGPNAHSIVAPAIVDGRSAMFSIHLDVRADRSDVRVHRHVHSMESKAPVRVGISGSGAQRLLRERAKLFRMLRLVSVHDQNRISAHSVADAFAALNAEVAQSESTVGQRSIVIWRYPPELNKGGGHQAYNGRAREPVNPVLPAIENGFDMGGMWRAIAPVLFKRMEGMVDSEPQQSSELVPGQPDTELNELIRKLPKKPDEELR
jgi:hypothetical protein